MSNLYSVNGTYGSGETPCTVLVYTLSNGLNWYCVEDSTNVNATWEEIQEGVDVETLRDVDYYSSNEEIETLDQLEQFIDNDGEKTSDFGSFTISIEEFDNQAMIDHPNDEVIRMLKGIIKNIEHYGLLNCDGLRLKDINGNSVGEVEVVKSEDY